MLPLRKYIDLLDDSSDHRNASSSVSTSASISENKKRKLSSEGKIGSRAVAALQGDLSLRLSKRHKSEFSGEHLEGATLLMADQEKRAFSKYGNHFNHEWTPNVTMANSSTKPSQTKKLVIKNFKAKPNLPDNFQEATWMKLREAIQAIHKKTSIAYSLEELYKAVENMCSHKMSALLYDQLKAECEQHVRSNIGQFIGYPFPA